MSTGRISTIDNGKGFGFITAAGSQRDGDLFFYGSAMTGGTFDDLREGQTVGFAKKPDPRSSGRFQAVDVHPVEVAAGAST